MQLSKLETQVYEKLRKNKINVFRIMDICLLFKFKREKSYNIIKALTKKKAIIKIKSGLYSFKDVSEFVIGTSLNWPSYVSFWSALNYYGFSDNLPKRIFFASRKYHKEINLLKFVFLKGDKFFGYRKIDDLIIAEKEKAIIDSLLYPKYSGGSEEIKKSFLAAINELNIEKMVDYINKIAIKKIRYSLIDMCEEFYQKTKNNKFNILKKQLIK